ncbi:MAG: Fur family transcriptional regulator [bacterium]
MNKKTKVNSNKNKLISNFIEKCEKNNLKVTPQRIAIYKELIKSENHPSINHIYNKIKKLYPSISFDTVNRTLLTFAEIGIANIVEGSGGPKRFDPNNKDHHHFICLKCNTIIDFYDSSIDNMEIPKELQENTKIIRKKIVLEGFCSKCNTI